MRAAIPALRLEPCERTSPATAADVALGAAIRTAESGSDRKTGSLDWILGTHANWRAAWSEKLLKPADGLEWQYHQHDCSVTPAGTVMCFDNGNERAAPPEPRMDGADCYSRAVEFAVDRETRTVRQVWSRGPQHDRIYSTYRAAVPPVGDVTRVTYGGVCTVDGVPSGKVYEGHCLSRLIEVTPGSPGETVFEMIVNDDSAEGAVGWSSFRAEHFPDFGTG